MLSTDVKLPRDFKVTFPDHCVVCHGATFRNTIRIRTHDLRLAGILFWFVIGKKATVEVPCCQGCGLRMRVQRWGSGLATLILVAVGAFLLFPMLQHLGPPGRRIAMIVIGLLCISPVAFWEIFWPPAVDISSTKKSISYEFKIADDANAFADLNNKAEWIEIS